MTVFFRVESLPALFGFEDDKDKLSQDNSIRHAAVNKRDYSGVRHGVLCRLEMENRLPRISIAHWSHLMDGSNQMNEEISISFRKETRDGVPHYQISKLSIFDKTYIDLDDPKTGDNPDLARKLPAAVKAIFDTITKDNQVPDLPTILEDFGITLARSSRRTMAGIRRGGLPAFNGAAKTPSDKKILYRRTFIPAMVGVEPHANDINPGPVERHDVVTDPQTGAQYDLFYRYQRDEAKPGSMNVGCYIRKDQQKDTTCLYTIETEEQDDDERLTEVKAISFFGRPINVKDESVLTRALETIRMHNRSIRHRHYGLGEGALLTEILHETGLIPHIYTRPKAPSITDGGRFRGRVLGGVNDGGAAISDKENSIGGNSYAASFDYISTKGEEKSFSIIVDDGIGFLDYQQDGFDYWKSNLDPFLRHESDPVEYKPETETLALVYTHKHKDHFFWEPGYVPPVMIMEPLTFRQFEDDVKGMKELTDAQRKKLIAACHVVDPAIDINPANPSKKAVKEFGDTVLEQWTEVFEDPASETGKGYAPRLRLYKKGAEEGAIELRLGYVSHSVPCMMVDIITPAKVVGLTGDYKFTKDVYVGKPTNPAWIRAQERDFLLTETTGADRKERTPDYAVLENNYTDFFYDRASKGRRLIMPIMPNDVQTLYAVTNAMKRARAKLLADNPDTEVLSHFTVDGKTLEDMVRYLNDGTGQFKKYLAKEEFDANGNLYKAGITVMTRSSKTIEALAKAQSPNLAIAVTGTQVEDMAVMTRAAEGELDRWELGPKDTVLNTKKAIPVGNNVFKRRQQKDKIESNFGAEYILPEEYEKEHGKIMSVSGHGGAEDLRLMIENSNAKYIGVTHGMRDRFEIVEKMIESAGKKPLRLSHQEERGGGKKDDFAFIAQTEEYRQFTREVYPRPFFWRTRWRDRAVVKMIPVLSGPVGQTVQAAETAALNNKQREQDHRRRFVATNDNLRDGRGDMIAELPPIGVQTHKDKGFYARHGIGMIASADTEGTGLVEEKARLSQFAMHVRDLESRKELGGVELKMQTPKHIIWSLFAALKTNSHPDTYGEGEAPRVFAHKVGKSLSGLKFHPEKQEATKTLLLGYNFHRHDSQLLAKEMGLNGQRDLFTHKSSGIYLFDVRQFARMVNGFAKDVLNVRTKQTKDGGQYLDFTLEGLCTANGIDYPRTHKAIDDTYPAYALYAYIENKLIASGRADILDQALINCDTHSDDIAKDIVGANLRPGAPRPVFSYVSHRADRPEPRLGVVVGTEINATSGRALIVYNLDHDPDKYLDLPEKDLLAMAKDPKNDVFDVIYLDKHPIIAPMDFAFAQGAQKQKIKFAKETYTARARMITRNLTRSIEQNAVARNKRTKQGKVDPFETRVLSAFGKALVGGYDNMRKKDTQYHVIDSKIYRIPQLKAEWGLIRRSSEDMKAYHIAPTETEIETGIDHKHVAHMAVLLGQLNNQALITLTEENLYDLWTGMKDEDQAKVSRVISSTLRAHKSMDADERKTVKEQVMSNLAIALDNVRTRRALVVHAPGAANHISLKKAKIQYERIMNDPALYAEYVENDPKKEAILKAWPDYLKKIETDPDLSGDIAHKREKSFIRRIMPRFA